VSKIDGINEALRLASEKLAAVDLRSRAESLGLGLLPDGSIKIRMFGADMTLDPASLALRTDAGAGAKPADHLLALHYLCCETPVRETGELVSFRDLPGGQFYYGPFRSRTVDLLVKSFGNDTERLRKNLARYDCEPLSMGDPGVKIHAIGVLRAALIYNPGDDEFPSGAEFLFNACVKRLFSAEDAAVLAGRICLGLL
jgi:hypothetical protein